MKNPCLRALTVAALAVVVATPVCASSHGHATYKPASETMQRGPKTKTDEVKTFHEKRTSYEKELKATERESDQVKVYKIKGLTHPSMEAGDLTATGKSARTADVREAPAPKIKPNGPGIAPPSARSSAGNGDGEGGGSGGSSH